MTDKRDIVQHLKDDAAGMRKAATEQPEYYAVLGVYAMTCCDAADEIERLRAEVDDLKRINMNLRYLIPEAVWMDEADRLRGDNQESPANEIERLRFLITAWADAEDLLLGPERFDAAVTELRKAVGR